MKWLELEEFCKPHFLLDPPGEGVGGVPLFFLHTSSWWVKLMLHTKNPHVWVLRVNLVLPFGPNHEFRFDFKLGPS